MAYIPGYQNKRQNMRNFKPNMLAGHDALVVIVEEYKTLCLTAMNQQREVVESNLKEKFLNEAVRYT